VPLTVNFTAQQTTGSPADILFTDTTTGTDVAVTQRRIYIQQADGAYVVKPGTLTQYELWGSFPGVTTITLEDILTKDIGARVVVEWLDISNVVLYNKILYFGFTSFNEDFDYSLTQLSSANPLLLNDNNFYLNRDKLRTEIDSGNNAILWFSDIYGAQRCYDRATELRINSQQYFNANS
jgi:hypothetical protein